MPNDMEEKSPASGAHEEIAEKRREKRYEAPKDCQQYIKIQIKNGSEFVPAILGNFSRNGILFESPVLFSPGQHTECFIALSLLVSREISFGVEVKYCYADHGSYITGATIDSISDNSWFDVFVEVYDFIVLRKGVE